MPDDTPKTLSYTGCYLDFSTEWVCGLSLSDTTLLHPYEPVGCFKDNKDPRALPIFIQRYPINNTDLANSFADIIHACATEVFKYGLWYFGVEYRHECWSGLNGGMTYNRHGRSDNCLWNYSVGSLWTIFVYRFVEGKLPVNDHFAGNATIIWQVVWESES